VDNARVETVPSDAAAPPPGGFLPLPETGRVFTGGYPIRRADVTPGGRLRFDALARYLQDVAEDDVAETDLREPYDWLVRRYAITIRGYPQRGQRLRLATFCSATGPRWAERGHVSNTIHWQAAEEALAGLDWLPARAEMEYHHPILPGDRLRLAYRLTPGRADIWLQKDARRLASAQLIRDRWEPGTGGPAEGNDG
jgi:acyl-ACP thioesterase